MLSAEEIEWHIALREREVEAAEKLGKLDLIPRSPQLSLQIAYLKLSKYVLKALLKAKARLHSLQK